ncbi:MAG: DNA mismatch repair endonuclease MutL [Deltaproteobacteria bacterium]|nr:DNA mismatch repair endonuclease MutL [Deltaproteobacteria bacterium]
MASRVKLLPEHLINQIAAGEVVERPASILKELLDNSLDAGATRLEVDLEAGGKKLIRVTDNGCGLNKEELFICLERHATSKLGPDSDLLSIATLGFRGEALPSIGSVARLAITSSPAPNGPGHRIRLEGGRLLGLDPAPANQGTVVEVRDLFYNVPARRKFLKSEATEKAHLLDVAQRYALARDDLRLVVRDSGRVILSVDPQQDLKARAAQILGPEIALSLRPMSLESADLNLSGWLCGPEATSRSSSGLFIYVLGRPVRDRLLTKAVTQGYGRALPPGRWPAGLVNINLDPRRVDVNVHPAKTEVRFREPGIIFQTLCELVAQVVQAPPAASPTPGPTPSLSQPPRQLPNAEPTLNLNSARPEYNVPDPSKPLTRGSPRPVNRAGQGFRPNPTGSAWTGQSRPTQALTPELPSPPAEPPWLAEGQDLFEAGPSASQPTLHPGENPTEPTPTPGLEPAGFQVLAQLGQSYILAQSPEGLLIVDQHAAHERIVFNRLKRTLAQTGLPSQRALFAETLDLTAHQILALNTLQAGLNHLGFELEPFGGPTYVLKGFPQGLEPSLAKEALVEMLAKAQNRLKNLEGAGLMAVLGEMTDTWLDSLACRAAVKAGEKLSRTEMEALLRDIQEAEAGGFCPHGRPALTVITFKELETRFGRR